MDFIHNGMANGSIASRLLANSMDTNVLRPYLDAQGRPCITQNVGGKPKAVVVHNANATLKKDEWIELDRTVLQAARERLRVIQDLRGAGLNYNVTNGLSKTVLEYQRVGNITPATISMDGLRKAEGDRLHYDLAALPLPIIHKDFGFSMREIAVSRSGGNPVDTSVAAEAAREVAIEAEKLLLGVSANNAYTYGGGTIYGLTNFPQRATVTLTSPTLTAWTPQTLLNEFLEMRQASTDNNYHGPWKVYVAPAWDQYLDEDWSSAKGDITVRERLLKVNGIQSINTADYLEDFDIIMVQMTSNVVRLVNGMDIQTVQWETQGGMEVNFKVMAILVPQVRADINGKTGLVHGGV
jgi:uncharacterized linocin/CFP29 family protein